MLTLQRTALLLAVLVVWEVSARTVIDPFWISQPTLLIVRLWELTASGDLIWHSSITILEAAVGLVLGLAVGVPIGLLLGISKKLADVVDPFVLGIYSLPRVALAPLFIIWFGIGLFSKVMLAFSLVVFIFILNTQEGLRNVDRELIDMARSMRASRGYITRKILLPSIVPWTFASMRIAIGLALIGAVIGELMGSSRGLGWYIDYSAGQFDTTGVFAGLIILMVLAMLANEAVKFTEERALSWRRTTGLAQG